MIKNIQTTASLFLVISLCNFQLKAIQNSTANIYTGIVAAVCAAGSYKIIASKPNIMHPGFLVGASCVISGISYCVLHKSTPNGRIKRANLLLNDIARHTLARVCFDDPEIFFDAVQDVYLTDDLPLISAYNHLLYLVPTMHYALGLINKASAEVGKDVLLQEECDASLSRANILFANISYAIKRIRDHKDYLSQLTIYRESLVQEEQTIYQQQIAGAKQSSAKVKWLNFFFK